MRTFPTFVDSTETAPAYGIKLTTSSSQGADDMPTLFAVYNAKDAKVTNDYEAGKYAYHFAPAIFLVAIVLAVLTPGGEQARALRGEA